MAHRLVFVNRRRGVDRRFFSVAEGESTAELHRHQRRNSDERRDQTRTLSDDYYAYMEKTIEAIQHASRSKAAKG